MTAQITTDKENLIARFVQFDLPVCSNFFQTAATSCQTDEQTLLNALRSFRERGLMRRFGAVLRHQKVGFRQNGLAVWAVPDADIEKVGLHFATLPFVSHCYQRQPAFLDRYNLFTMIHGRDEEIRRLAESMAASCPGCDYRILDSVEEYKKTSPEYFT